MTFISSVGYSKTVNAPFSLTFIFIVSGKFFLLDFRDGPLVVSGEWITSDRLFCAWPPNGDSMQPLEYDKFVQEHHVPTDDWNLHKVSKVRACGGNFRLLLFI